MIKDVNTFFNKVLEQVAMKSPDLVIKLMNEDPSQQEQYLVELVSDRISKLLADPSTPEKNRTMNETANDPATTVTDQDALIKDYEYLIEKNSELAAAVGACECWGEDDECPVCFGHGSAGWRTPDPHGFSIFVRPALHAPVYSMNRNSNF